MRTQAKNIKIISIIITTLLIALLCPGLTAVPCRDEEENGSYLRLHIVANSNSPQDQGLKLKVRDYVLVQLGPLLLNAGNYREAREGVEKSLADLETGIRRFMRLEGDYAQVRCELLAEEFPATAYKNFSLPKGRYHALRITLGNGNGSNWWCVLYPALCLRDLDSLKALPVMTASDKPAKTMWQLLREECRKELAKVWLTQ